MSVFKPKTDNIYTQPQYELLFVRHHKRCLLACFPHYPVGYDKRIWAQDFY